MKRLRRAADADAVRALEERGAIAVPVLLPLVLSGDDDTSSRAAAAIRALLSTWPRRLLPQLDESSRSYALLPDLDISAWREMRPKDVRQLAALPRATSHVLGVASFHHDGHVREAAVTALDRMTDGDELAYLLVRVNDWVSPVAERALDAVTRRIVPEYATAFVSSLPLLLRLDSNTRRVHRSLLDAAFAFLRQPDQQSALALGARSSDLLTQRFSHRLAREGAGDDLLRVLRGSLESHDVIVRLEAARYLRTRSETTALAELLDVLEHDRSVAVRREGLLAAFDRLPGDVPDRAERALLDGSRSVRDVARFILAKTRPGFAPKELYRSRLSSDDRRVLSAALAGLAEIGDRADAPLVHPFVADPRVGIRRTAIRALGKLDAEQNASILVAALADPSPGVTHAAREALLAHPTLYDRETITGLLHAIPYVHGVLDAFALGARLGKWPSLLLLLEASGSDELAVADAARVGLARWVVQANRRFASPRPDELVMVNDLLARRRFAIEDRVLTEITAAVRPWQF
ncbi:MAG: HEAT repeat domain-containing protein [Gemmatimonadaceae bacterium]